MSICISYRLLISIHWNFTYRIASFQLVPALICCVVQERPALLHILPPGDTVLAETGIPAFSLVARSSSPREKLNNCNSRRECVHMNAGCCWQPFRQIHPFKGNEDVCLLNITSSNSLCFPEIIHCSTTNWPKLCSNKSPYPMLVPKKTLRLEWCRLCKVISASASVTPKFNVDWKIFLYHANNLARMLQSELLILSLSVSHDVQWVFW